MAFSSNLTASAASVARAKAEGRAPGLFARIDAWRAKRRQAARIAFELNCYSERELADLGLTREDIVSVARGEYRRA